MRDKRAAITAAVRHAHAEGDLPWGYDTVYEKDFLTPYPKRGKLDETLAGHFDACWPDDDLPWMDDQTDPADHGDGDADSHGHGGDDDGSDGADGGIGGQGDGDAHLFDGPGGEAAAVSAVVVPDVEADLERTHHDKMQKLLEQRDQSLEMGVS